MNAPHAQNTADQDAGSPPMRVASVPSGGRQSIRFESVRPVAGGVRYVRRLLVDVGEVHLEVSSVAVLGSATDRELADLTQLLAGAVTRWRLSNGR